jgi:hypothetical protein
MSPDRQAKLAPLDRYERAFLLAWWRWLDGDRRWGEVHDEIDEMFEAFRWHEDQDGGQ